MAQSKRIIITGEKEVGKTILCRQLATLAQESGATVRGLLSLAEYEGGQKTGIRALNLDTGQTRQLVAPRQAKPTDPSLLRWSLNPEAVQWGNNLLETSTPCDLLIVDELGPTEWAQGKGWQMGLSAIDKGDFRVTTVIIRPSLLNKALARWPSAEVVEVLPEDNPNRTAKTIYQQLCLG